MQDYNCNQRWGGENEEHEAHCKSISQLLGMDLRLTGEPPNNAILFSSRYTCSTPAAYHALKSCIRCRAKSDRVAILENSSCRIFIEHLRNHALFIALQPMEGICHPPNSYASQATGCKTAERQRNLAPSTTQRRH